MNQSMYEITEQFRALANMDGTDEEIAQAIKDTWESVELAFEEKAENYAKIIKADIAYVKNINDEIARLQALKKPVESKTERMITTLTTAMQAAGRVKFTTPLFSFNIQKNAPSVIVDDESTIPDEYKTYETKINKTAIKEVLKNGTVPGAHLEQSESLRIK